MNDRISDVLAKAGEIQRMNAEIQREYREGQIAKRREQTAVNVGRFRASHPDRWPAIQRRRATKHRNEVIASRSGAAPELVQAADRICAAWKTSDDWQCGYCGKTVPAAERTTDHVIALSKGGLHIPENLKPACRACNSRKGTRSTYYA